MTTEEAGRAGLVPGTILGESLRAPRTLTDHATQMIRHALLGGRWSDGERIRVEETAGWLSISPSPVREALRALASEGLVIQLPQRGYRVPKTTVKDVEETYRLRLLLDPLAVELAAPRFAAAEVSAAERALSELAAAYAAGDWGTIDRAHRSFHFSLYEPADSDWLIRILSMLWSNSQRYQHLSLPLRGSADERVAAHRHILDACVAGDGEMAAERMRAHLDRTYQLVRDLLLEEQDNGDASTVATPDADRQGSSA